jgi:hypothetical protein
MNNSPDEPVIRENTIEAKPWHLITEEKTEQSEADRRLSICQSCQFYRPKSERCGKCGCFMKLKSTIKRAHCPVHKW